MNVKTLYISNDVCYTIRHEESYFTVTVLLGVTTLFQLSSVLCRGAVLFEV